MFVKKFEEAIVRELLLILLVLRVGAVIGLLVMFWLTPMPWKALVMAPLLGGPVMVLVEEVLQRVRGPEVGGISPGYEAERRRVRARMEEYRRAYLDGGGA